MSRLPYIPGKHLLLFNYFNLKFFAFKVFEFFLFCEHFQLYFKKTNHIEPDEEDPCGGFSLTFQAYCDYLGLPLSNLDVNGF